jgi:Flp pilus assembly protein CpaB
MIKTPNTPRVILALAPKAVSDALGIGRPVVAAAIASGALPVHVNGVKHRILTVDIEAWVRSWPAPSKKRGKSHGKAN